ncbi:HNH endonuclease signature motif containing protein [Ruania rhizosphaerae]|uniref:HNH endonuclease signature motif containing protein n=1 Tax=Ruania rhizosphaerae TaxID=1840413 RepID=UPI00135A7559|nr:HNH endonuclease signature motif containing protein [Ruania rhizosphaerae]
MTVIDGTQQAADQSGVEATLAQISTELDRLLEADLHQLDSSRLRGVVEHVEQVQRRVEAVTNRVMRTVEADGVWSLHGHRSLTTWWADATGRRKAPTAARLRTAQRLAAHLPLAEAAASSGEISIDHATLLAREATRNPVLIEHLADTHTGEAFLVQQAKLLPPDSFARVLAAWTIRADPEGADRNWREQSTAEHVHLSSTLDGYQLDGWLTTQSGQTLAHALDAIIGTPAEDDDRTRSQHQGAAMVTMARHALDSGSFQPHARVRPTLLVHVPGETLHLLTETPPARPGHPDQIDPRLPYGVLRGAEPATLGDGSPITFAQLATHACGGEFTRVVLDPAGQPLDVGRSRRLHTPAQTRAIWARDRHCQFPGCDAPPGWGEIHHSTWWSRGGTTDVEHGILLCWHHHAYVHQRDITIRRHADHWHFTRPGGHPLGYRRLPACEILARPRAGHDDDTIAGPDG